MAASAARNHFSDALEAAEGGETTMIIRHSKHVAALVPAQDLDTYNMVIGVMRELGELIEISNDPEIVAAVQKGKDDISRGNISWIQLPPRDANVKTSKGRIR